MCTKEDLSELQRATFLLRKGYEIQKLSVSACVSMSLLPLDEPNQLLTANCVHPCLCR